MKEAVVTPIAQSRPRRDTKQRVLPVSAEIYNRIHQAMGDDVAEWTRLKAFSTPGWRPAQTIAGYTETAIRAALPHAHEWIELIPLDGRLIQAQERARAAREGRPPRPFPKPVNLSVLWTLELANALNEHKRPGSLLAEEFTRRVGHPMGQSRLTVSLSSLVTGALKWSLDDSRRRMWLHDVPSYGVA